MDSINVEKLQAMKRYDVRRNIFSTLIHYTLLVLMVGLFLSSPLWLSALCSSVKLFFLDSLPKVTAFVFGPKCLFVVFNLIIIFLVGESRLTSSSSTKLDIYEEYVTHNQRLRGSSSYEEKAKESVLESTLVEEKKEESVSERPLVEEKHEEKVEEKGEEVREEEEKDMAENVEELEEEVKGESVSLEVEEEIKEEENQFADEELNKRIEDFIAMVNMQRRLEARMVVCCG